VYKLWNELTVKGCTLAETVNNEKIAVSLETTSPSESIAKKKTIVYETRVDTTVVKLAAEKLKDQLFTRFGFLKPKPTDVQFVSIEKYYEPYSMISGRYFVDYYRKCAYHIEVDEGVLEAVLLNTKLEPEESADFTAKRHKVIKLKGEERLKFEVKDSLVLDRLGQLVTTEKLPSAPSERNPKKILAEFGLEKIAEDSDLEAIRSKIVKRPKDMSRIVCELFEVNERTVIYTPRFRVLCRNLKTGETKTVEFDGVTSEVIRQPKHEGPHNIPPVPPPPPPPIPEHTIPVAQKQNAVT